MAVTKKIEIDGKPVEFKASAAIPRIYRNKFGRDVYKDLMVLNDAEVRRGLGEHARGSWEKHTGPTPRDRA